MGENEFGVNWNANQGWLMLLLDINRGAYECRKIGDTFGWYSCLRDMYAMIHHKMKLPGQEEIEKEVEELFDQAKEFMARSDNIRGANNIALHTLDRIRILLWDLVEEYNIIELRAERPDPKTAVSIGVKG